jgi:hypothetical protein
MPPHTTPAPHDALCREIAHRDVASMTGGGISSATHTVVAAASVPAMDCRRESRLRHRQWEVAPDILHST